VSDVVERAREFTAQVTIFKDGDPPMYCTLIDEMAAEIERLRKRVSELAASYANVAAIKYGDLEAEIERLRALLAPFIKAAANFGCWSTAEDHFPVRIEHCLPADGQFTLADLRRLRETQKEERLE
jgi:hypothetical protein